MSLVRLIAEARALAGDASADLCALLGHDWKMEGGRRCPHELEANCSQTVYRCTRCPAWDYGDPGGPAHDECENHCPHEHLKAEKDPA